MNNVVRNFTGLGLILSLAMPLPATAQGTGGGGADGFHIEEMVVTARHREESLQDAPVSISAFSAEDLKLKQVRSTDRLGEITPNLTFDSHAPSSGSNASSQIFIRGIGQTDFTAVTDPGVGLYVDGVYYARAIGGSLDFLSLKQVEVLRGPQGTLFGRNTIGGAILIHTQRPGDELAGNVEAQVGSDNMANVTANLDVPLTDTLLSRFSVATRNRDGYVDRVFDGQDLGDDSVLNGRMALQWNTSDTLEFYLAADYTRERENGSPAVSLGLNDQQTFAHLSNALDNPTCPLTPPPAPPGPGRDTNNDPNCANDSRFKSKTQSEGTAQVASELDYWGIALTADWQVTDGFGIKSITAYRDMDSFSARDGDAIEWQIFHTQDPFEQQQFSQELQFHGNTLQDSLKWLIGLYYFTEEADNPNPVQFPPTAVGAFVSGGQTDNDNTAIFGQATWDITDKLALTGGLRYTDETKRFSPYSFIPEGAFYVKPGAGSPAERFFDCPTGVEPTCTTPGVPGRLFTPGDRLIPEGEYERDFDDWTPMANIAYNFTDEMMVYFNYAEGFKSGGFDQRYNREFLDGPTSFEPETATTYELGWKSVLFDSGLRLNAAAFFSDYEDLHIIVREGFAPITFNAGDAEIKGFEIEASWVPTEAWLLQASVGHIDAEYTRLDDTVTSGSPITLDNSLAQTPEWSGNASVAYTANLSWGSLTPRVDWSYRSETYQDAINSVQLLQPDYHLINAALIYTSPGESWDVVLAGRNLTGERYLIAGISAYNTGASYTSGVFSRKAEWSLAATFHF